VRILLDNRLPIRLRHHFPGHEVETALYRGWAALENGELISAAVDAGFDVVISIDQGHDFERAVAGRPIVAILFPGTQGGRLEDILPLVPKVEAALGDASTGIVTRL
jgi:hypothetical protein